MSVANVVLDHILKKDFLEHVQKVGDYLKNRLEEEKKRQQSVVIETE